MVDQGSAPWEGTPAVRTRRGPSYYFLAEVRTEWAACWERGGVRPPVYLVYVVTPALRFPSVMGQAAAIARHGPVA